MDEDIQDRYLHLLQPIRDVDRNWDGNIKEHLNDYLEKLKTDRERNTVNDEGELVKFNFSEAAMLLQGSLYIYAKKVDNLHAAISDVFAHGTGKTKKKRTPDQLDATQAQLTGVTTNEFVLLDEKSNMLDHAIDVQWLMDQDHKREKKPPPKVGNKRVEGHRDSLVKLPISFIPTRKSAPSAHYLRFKQNEEFVFINQTELFSFSVHAFTEKDASMITVLINTAYVDLRNKFTPDYIPYLRDQANRRCDRIGYPHNIDAPHEAFERLCSYDQREFRPDDSFLLNMNEAGKRLGRTINDFAQDDFGEEYGAGGTTDDTIPIESATNRLSTVEAVRESQVVIPDNRTAIEPRESSVPMATMCDESRHATRGHDISTATAVSTTTAGGVKLPLNVEEELALMDEYSTTTNVRLRRTKRPDGAVEAAKAKKLISRRAEKQVKTRNELIKKQMVEAGKDYEREMDDISNYMSAKLFSRKICKLGSILENFNPSLRDRHMQALNRAFYEQEKYEKSMIVRKRQEKEERERRRRVEEQQRRRKLRLIDTNVRRSTRITGEEPEDGAAKRRRKSASPSTLEPPADDFGAPIDDVDEDFGGDDGDHHSLLENEYDPVTRMAREIDDARTSQPDDVEDVMSEIDIFPNQTPEHTDDVAVRGDMSATFLFGDDNEETRSLSRFVSNDRQFFEFTELEKFFKRVSLESFGTDRAFIQQLQSFWNADNDQTHEGVKKRLQNWTKHIVQRIEEDTKHKPFEIHNYGGDVLGAFGGIGQVIEFKELVRNVPRYEVSRYLLAVLILANCGNVEIISQDEPTGQDDRVQNNMKIRLLSLIEHRRVFESEQALITKS